ncbi:MAG TPA: hypothetical protein VF771_05360, partial [Longimicrobiaceae bacterium]
MGGLRAIVTANSFGCLLLAAAPAAAQHRSLAGRDLATAAALLRLEDRREYDSTAINAAAADANPEVRRRAVLAAGRIGD